MTTANDSAGLVSPNFGHLAKVVPLLALQGAKAERYVFEDPSIALVRLRQLGEMLAQEAAARIGLYVSPTEAQADLLRRLRDERIIDFEVADLFHALRKAGNDAVHHDVGTQREALHGLRMACRLGVWFQKAFVDPAFKGGPFVPPPDPREAERALKEELAELRKQNAEREAEAAGLRATAKQEAELRAQAAKQAKAAYEELAVAIELASEAEANAANAAKEKAEVEARLAALQAAAAAAPKALQQAVVEQVREATSRLELDESETRLLIDAQLRAAGWEADTVALTYKSGARPIKGKNLAIAEWPTTTGPADYVLFCTASVETGLRPDPRSGGDHVQAEAPPSHRRAEGHRRATAPCRQGARLRPLRRARYPAQPLLRLAAPGDGQPRWLLRRIPRGQALSGDA